MGLNDFHLHTRLRESFSFYSHSVAKWPEVAQTFVVIEFIREITAKKPCKYREYGSFWVYGAFALLSFF